MDMTVYDDRTFTFVLKTSPTPRLILKALNVEKGSGKAGSKKAGSITQAQIKEIAEEKMVDMNAGSLAAAMRLVEGTCRSMGVEVK